MIEIKNGLQILSASRLKTFLSCRAKHYFQYIEELPSLKTPALSLGSAVHFAVESGYAVGSEIAPYAALIAHTVALCYEQQYYRDGLQADPQLLRSIMRYPFSQTVRPKEVELEFTIPFPFDAPICYLHGYMDQVYENGIIDLKTNRKEPDPETLHWDVQFHIYARAFEHLYQKQPQFIIWKHVRTLKDIYVSVYGTEEKENHLLRMIQFYLHTQDAVVRNTGFECTYCSFREQCLRS